MTEPRTATLFSADSHVIESLALWDGLLPESFWGSTLPGRYPTGDSDPTARVPAMELDGVVGEILYPTFGLPLFGIEDAGLQEACCHRYNQWLADHCAAVPTRLFGIGMIPTYDMDAAVRELQFCADQGMRGGLVWLTPHPDIPFWSDHYEPFWSACQDLGLPVSLHTLTGFNYFRTAMTTGIPAATNVDGIPRRPSTASRFHIDVRQKLNCVVEALGDLMFSDVFERHPDLRLVLVEHEVAWLPFVIDQWDYYARNKLERYDPHLPNRTWPSDYMRTNVFATFFRDPLAGYLSEYGGTDNWMWSSDYPHPNSTWPHSRTTVETLLAGLPAENVEKLAWRNAASLYNLEHVLLVTDNAS
jgi:predicted TIM-barrel fold metal-dependent hydrolase